MKIRKARPADLEACLNLDHSIVTEHAWRMEEQERDGAITITFQPVRLPRRVRLSYPRDREALTVGWTKSDRFLIAGDGTKVYGYTALCLFPGHGLAWVQDLVVDSAWRRQGIGQQLLHQAAAWALEQGMQKLVVEVPTRNHPGVCFCRAQRLAFCGYHDHHWRTKDIALLFGSSLR